MREAHFTLVESCGFPRPPRTSQNPFPGSCWIHPGHYHSLSVSLGALEPQAQSLPKRSGGKAQRGPMGPNRASFHKWDWGPRGPWGLGCPSVPRICPRGPGAQAQTHYSWYYLCNDIFQINIFVLCFIVTSFILRSSSFDYCRYSQAFAYLSV